MSTSGTRLRRGLPRVAGGEPWPPVVAGEADAAPEAPAAQVQASPQAAAPEPAPATQDAAPTPVTATPAAPAPVPAAPGGAPSLRRGLPRTPGGEAWPPADAAPAAGAPAAPVSEAEIAEPAPVSAEAEPEAADAASTAPAPAPAARSSVSVGGVELRRGLPREAGGDPWPPAGVTGAVPSGASAPAAPAADVEAAAVASAPAAEAVPAASAPVVQSATGHPLDAPLPFPQTVFPGRYADVRPAPTAEPERVGPFTKAQWAGIVVVLGGGLLVAAAMAVFLVRWLLSAGPLHDFVQMFPGEYHLPEGAPVGFPAWLGWQHFFNVFLMVLIIRSGLRVRTEKRPSAFWTPRNDPKGKVSLTIWFHQALDVLWLVNGAIFVVLLFVTGQWMRVIPTSWEVFPNAISAVLQYISLDWPTENGWVNYNSVQQLAYFATIFVAAPLAVVTGYRMSGMWPKNADRLNRLYPIEWARALHFPVMLYFVVFIAIHVFLVIATGALRNLNHMYAAQGSVDPAVYAENWTGFWFFAASLVVIAAAWVAARPLVIAPVAKLFGTVSSR